VEGAFTLAVAWGGPVLAGGAQWISRKAGVWAAMVPAMSALGVLALLTGRPVLSGDLGVVSAAGLGLGAGLLLYAGTVAFMFVFRGWPFLARQAGKLYEQRGGLPLTAALALAMLVVAPGEEGLWRGVVQPVLADGLGEVAGTAVAWAGYVGANALSGSLPVVLGAVVGGAAWAGLALWTGGILAGLLCHCVWTGLMILRPPVFSGRS